MARTKTPRGRGKATKKLPRLALATRQRPTLATRPRPGLATFVTGRNPQSPTDSSMQPETQVGTRSSARERRPPALLGNYEVTDGRRPVNRSSATSVPAPPPHLVHNLS